MSDLLIEFQEHLCILTLNRESKRNAFDDALLTTMQEHCNNAIQNPKVRVIVIKAVGKHFSAGADLHWMQRMAHFTLDENKQDAMILANLMSTLYNSPKPTIAMVQGSAYGGGAGLVAACDIGIAATNASFCFSEVKLGLVPAVISPFVVEAIGARAAKALFMSAEVFDAKRALDLHLIQHCVDENNLFEFTVNYAKLIANNAPNAVKASKQLVREVMNKNIDETLSKHTADIIAEKRISEEGQKGLTAFLNKQTPNWN